MLPHMAASFTIEHNILCGRAQSLGRRAMEQSRSRPSGKSAAEDRSFGVAGLSRQRADDHQADQRNPARACAARLGLLIREWRDPRDGADGTRRTLEKRTQGDGLGEKIRQRAWPSSPSTGLHKNRVVLHRGGAQALGLSRWVGRDYRGSYKRIHRLACGGFTAHLQSGGLRARPSHFALKSSLGD